MLLSPQDKLPNGLRSRSAPKGRVRLSSKNADLQSEITSLARRGFATPPNYYDRKVYTTAQKPCTSSRVPGQAVKALKSI